MLKEQDTALVIQHNGVHVRRIGVSHRADEYDEHGFDGLFRMQREHFGSHGRHRFLLAALEMKLASVDAPAHTLSAIDLGAGCGGWIDYLLNRSVSRFGELALADSSLKALEFAATVIGSQAPRFHVDLRDLGWKEHWDIVFLLDVLEHIQDHSSPMPTHVVRSDRKAIGVEISKRRVGVARDTVQKGSQAQVVQADVRQLPLQ